MLFSATDALGRATLSEPPVFTSIGASTLDNGVRVSVTHVIANPTGVWDVNGSAAIEQKGYALFEQR